MLRAVRRNTELGLIVLGTLVTVGAYVLAVLGRGRHDPRRHRPVPRGRARAPARRPPRHPPAGARTPTACCCPLAGLLNGIGYVFIARLDEAKADPRPRRAAGGLDGRRHRRASSPRCWSCAGSATSSATATRSASSALVLLLLPLVPGHRPRDQRRPHLGEHRAGQLPARRVRQDRPGHLLRRRTWSRSASCSP